MKKLLAISLLLLYLLAGTELRELGKVPFLAQHFYEHKAENKGLTLVQFLRLHYAIKQTRDKDIEKDQRLPFNSNDDCLCCHLKIFGQDLSCFSGIKPLQAEKTCFGEYEDPFKYSIFNGTIWQPPRSC